MIRALVIAAALSVAAPAAFAQTAPAPAPQAQAPGEAEFNATAEAFGHRMETMQSEMQTAITEAGGDAARQSAALDAIEARYQPEVEAFVAAFQTFYNQQAAAVPETERAGMMAGLAQAIPQLRSITHLIRSQLEQATSQAAAAPAGS